jgi:peptidoglycan hydrolase CwlO-like protein
MSQSDSGAKGIEISELIRVFGELSQSRSDGITVTKSQEVTDEVSGATGRIDALVAEIDGLRALLVSKDDVIDSQKKHIDSLENTVMLLTHDVRQSNSVVVRRWWKFWS